MKHREYHPGSRYDRVLSSNLDNFIQNTLTDLRLQGPFHHEIYVDVERVAKELLQFYESQETGCFIVFNEQVEVTPFILIAMYIGPEHAQYRTPKRSDN